VRKRGSWLSCRSCGKSTYVRPFEQARFRACSKACNDELKRIKGPGSKVIRRDGYVKVYFPTHPRADKTGFIMEHRLVMEQVLGRPLERGEHVHHINEVKSDNRPENLQVMKAGDHSRETNASAKRKRVSMRERLAEYERRYGPLS
jgi:hypothetical protein